MTSNTSHQSEVSLFVQENTNNNTNKKLDYQIIKCSSEDKNHPVNELYKGLKGKGWYSKRFCFYPQEIEIEFKLPVQLKQILFIINETYIPKKINIFYSNEITKKDQEVNYTKLGFINLENNSHLENKCREYRKINIDLKCKYIKLFLEENYKNTTNNLFNQIGINSIEFYGTYSKYLFKNNTINNIFSKKNTGKISKYINSSLNDNDNDKNENLDNNNDLENSNYINDSNMDTNAKNKINDLKKEMEKAKNIENYEECKLIKNKIQRVKKISSVIFNLEKKKKFVVLHENFDMAKSIKNEINYLKKKLNSFDDAFIYNENEDCKFDIGNINNSINNNNYNNLINLNINNKYDTISVNDKFNTFSINDKNNNNNYNCNNNINNDLNKSKREKSENSLNNINLSMSSNPVNSNNSIFEKSNIYKRQDSKFKISTNNNGNNRNRILIEDVITSYDDLILPTLLKKEGNKENEELEENGTIEKKELEEVDKSILHQYSLLIPFIGKQGIRKLFSHQILWKDEGFLILLNKLNFIFSSQKTIETINKIVILIMKLVTLFLNENHPSTVSNSLDLFYKLLLCIKDESSKKSINYEFKITDKILVKIKKRLGDVSLKVRSKAIELYNYMLQQDFCDYNKLVIELIEEELTAKDEDEIFSKKKNTNNIKINITTKLKIGKLNIFSKLLDNLNYTFSQGRSTLETFPISQLADYFILNINHSKSEVRKINKICIVKFINYFGMDIIKNKIEKNFDKNNISKIMTEIPILKEAFPEIVREEEEKIKIQQINNDHCTSSLSGHKLKKSSSQFIFNRSSSISSFFPVINSLNNKIKLKPIICENKVNLQNPFVSVVELNKKSLFKKNKDKAILKKINDKNI